VPKVLVRLGMNRGTGNYLGVGRWDGQTKCAQPPRPPFCLTIGVAGHRPDRLPLEARARVMTQVSATLDLFGKTARAAWERYSQFYTEESPALRVMSALAEGSDRIGASAGLEHGYSLTAILPFEIEDYLAAPLAFDAPGGLGQAELDIVVSTNLPKTLTQAAVWVTTLIVGATLGAYFKPAIQFFTGLYQ
jgi:hypothetical protein